MGGGVNGEGREKARFHCSSVQFSSGDSVKIWPPDSSPSKLTLVSRIKAKGEECKKYVDHVAKLEEQYKWVLTERDSFGQGGDFDFTKQVWGGRQWGEVQLKCANDYQSVD